MRRDGSSRPRPLTGAAAKPALLEFGLSNDKSIGGHVIELQTQCLSDPHASCSEQAEECCAGLPYLAEVPKGCAEVALGSALARVREPRYSGPAGERRRIGGHGARAARAIRRRHHGR
jgi:hypothetical protein